MFPGEKTMLKPSKGDPSYEKLPKEGVTKKTSEH
jgi:hypothetical protein